MPMKRLAFLTLALLLLSAPCGGQELPKREFRGAWLHIVGNKQIKDLSREQIQQWFTATLDSLQEAGCNAVIFQVRPQADAFYISELEPWTRFLTGEQGVAPDPLWDPLQFMVEQCHARGMELHAWLNPYRVTSDDKEQLHPDHLYFKKPEIFRRYGKQLYFDPGEPESVAHTVRVIADIVSRYDVDAIHFDDYEVGHLDGCLRLVGRRVQQLRDFAGCRSYCSDRHLPAWVPAAPRRAHLCGAGAA